jgi:hypothetical protein
MSRPAGSIGRDPFRLSPVTPGTLGCLDAADPAFGLNLGDTPGPLGRNDCADPDARAPYGLGIGKLHMTFSRDKDLLLWDYDPKHLLQDDRLNPEFVEQAHRAMAAAVALGLRPRVHQAYRSPEESDRLSEKHKAHAGGRAAPAWQSVHNYGLAMDVWLYDRKSRYIDTKVRGWYKLYKLLAAAASSFLWGASFDDSDHFEYHPNWERPAKGKHLISVRTWAMKTALAHGKMVKYDALASGPRLGQAPAQRDFIPESDIEWLPYFWWAAGAQSEDAPSDAYLRDNRPPIQA